MTKERMTLFVITAIFFSMMLFCAEHDKSYATIVSEPERVERVVAEQRVETEKKTVAEPSPSPQTVSFTMTAYCPCEICCGEWANNRPDGKVYGASGRELVPGYSIAVDPDIIPLGTIVKIDGREYRADDTGGAVKGNKIDLYVSTHEEAMGIGIRDCEVEIWH